MGATGGDIMVMSGYSVQTTSGHVTIKTVNAGHAGVSGALTFSSGTTSAGNSGVLMFGTGSATGGKGGQVHIAVGSGNSGTGGNMQILAGQTWAANKDGGHVALLAGTGGQASAKYVLMLLEENTCFSLHS